jgi:hypothetical protein
MLGVPGRELTTIARRITWMHLGHRRSYLAIVALGGVAMIAFLGLTPPLRPIPSFWRGLGAGVSVALLVGGVIWTVFSTDGSLNWRLGAFGELWTSDVLRKLGPRWTVLNNLRVPGANDDPLEIDHVAVGPGGVLVVDSKLWPTKRRLLDTTSNADVNKAALGAQRQAAVLRLHLSGLVGRQTVVPSVMFWGTDLLSAKDGVATNRNGVTIVHGRDSDALVEIARTHSSIDEATIAAVLQRLEPCLVPRARLRDAKPPLAWSRPSSQ